MVQCRGTKKDGTQCRVMTRHESGFCHVHRGQAVSPPSSGIAEEPQIIVEPLEEGPTEPTHPAEEAVSQAEAAPPAGSREPAEPMPETTAAPAAVPTEAPPAETAVESTVEAAEVVATTPTPPEQTPRPESKWLKWLKLKWLMISTATLAVLLAVALVVAVAVRPEPEVLIKVVTATAALATVTPMPTWTPMPTYTPRVSPTEPTMTAATYPLAGQRYTSSQGEEYQAIWDEDGWLHQLNLPTATERKAHEVSFTIEEGTYAFNGVECQLFLDQACKGDGGKLVVERGNNLSFSVDTADGGQAWARVTCRQSQASGFSIEWKGPLHADP